MEMTNGDNYTPHESGQGKPMQELKRIIEEWHGHRLAAASQYLRQGEMKDAHKAQIEADVCHRILKQIEDIEDGSGYEGNTPSYIEISRSRRECETAVKEENDSNKPYERGLQ